MDYEKIHKDTINRLQQMVRCGKITVEVACGICADFIPESEDEEMRKSIIGFLKTIASLKDGKTVSNKDFDSKVLLEWATWLENVKTPFINNTDNSFICDIKNIIDEAPGVLQADKNKLIAWLENQGQNPAWSEEDEEMLEDIRFNYESNKSGMTEGLIEQYNKWFEKIKSLKPQSKQKWTEEDEQMFKQALKYLKQSYYTEASVIEWLKSLKYKVKSCWKPSEEHITYLQAVVNDVHNIGSESCCIALRDLLEQLKKL